MTTLENQTVLVIGGSSGIGFGIAKISLLALASHVIVASSSSDKVANAVERLQEIIRLKQLPGTVSGETVDAKSSESIKALLTKVGEIDHLVYSSGDRIPSGFPAVDLDTVKGMFDVRFWGAALAAQNAKIKAGGSITLTTGTVVLKPFPTWAVAGGMIGATDALTRGLAVDLAPIRVNSICPGAVITEMWDKFPKEQKEGMLKSISEKLPVKHIADADEVAEAYLFAMRCKYITGQRIVLDGGDSLV